MERPPKIIYLISTLEKLAEGKPEEALEVGIIEH